MQGIPFKESHSLSRDEQFLWGYYGEFAHTHLGLGHNSFSSLYDRSMTKTIWKMKWSAMRAYETQEERAEKAFNKNHPELNP